MWTRSRAREANYHPSHAGTYSRTIQPRGDLVRRAWPTAGAAWRVREPCGAGVDIHTLNPDILKFPSYVSLNVLVPQCDSGHTSTPPGLPTGGPSQAGDQDFRPLGNVEGQAQGS